MILSTWLNNAEKRLTRVLKDKDLAHQDVSWIACKALNKDRAWLLAHNNNTPTTIQYWKLERLLRRRLKDEPLAYLLNSAPFYRRDFFVDKRVLIPRPETEDLIEIALRRTERKHHLTIIDIGTGSGAIATTIALEKPKAHVLASDTSLRALSVAKKNAKRLHANVYFTKGSLLHTELISMIPKQDPIIIIANLPYLPPSDKRIMPKSVTRFEPAQALFAENKGLALNEHLLQQSAKLLTTSYSLLTLLLEFDPPQAKKLRDIAQSLFPLATIRIHQDRCGRERFLEVSI